MARLTTRREKGQTPETVGAVPATTALTTLTGNVTVNTKGAWVELVAATVREWKGFWLHVAPASGARIAIDIGFGVAGSYTVAVPDLVYNTNTVRPQSVSIYIPLRVPRGTQVGARVQSSTSNGTCLVAIQGQPGRNGYRRCTHYGYLSGSTNGTALDAGAVANTDSAYVQLVASTTFPADAVLVLASELNGGAGTAVHLVDVAVGAAASEVDVLSDLVYWRTSSHGCPNPWGVLFDGLSLPAGVRLSARCRSNSTDASARLLKISLLGFN